MSQGNAYLKPPFCSGGYLPNLIQSGDHGTLSSIKSHEYWMQLALQESMKSAGHCNPNPAVGCIITSRDEEIARGHTQKWGDIHAERDAFQKIKGLDRYSDLSAYVTLEPCTHLGKQPPCIDLFLGSPIQNIFIGTQDTNPQVCGEGIQKLRNAGKKVEVGILEKEIIAWNAPFFYGQKFQKPFFALKWAQTLDGQLADDRGVSQWISGESSRQYAHWLRQKYDAVLVGIHTFLSDRPKLTTRYLPDWFPHPPKNPLRLVWDPHGTVFNIDVDLQAKLLNDNMSGSLPPTVFLTQTTSSPANSWLQSEILHKRVYFITIPSVNVITPSPAKSSLYPDLLQSLTLIFTESKQLEEIYQKPVQSLMIEGGPKLITRFLESGDAQILHVFIAPIMTGGSTHRIELKQSLADSTKYRILSQSQISNDTLIELI